ncbi:MAG: GAF domain-containing protein [Gammaproteobacteria bacterium]|nr:GAF domain-containing protein [Gammaproteobacteria bacterium]HJO11859.1 GAF domain-containing protein [Gammaproteobacteria bacterium]
MGGTSGNEVEYPDVRVKDPDTGKPNRKNVASYVAITRESVNIPDAYTADGFDFSGTREFDQTTGYRSTSFLAVPLMPHQGAVIGVLQLINAKDSTSGKVIPFAEDIEGFVLALATQAAVALENQNLLNAQRALLDSFIELIVGAIDAKSHYTAGHCARVPEIAKLLADAACGEDSGEFADFLMTDEEFYEFRIGAMLHDCGKVTTPEYVVDKATKLETIYNRIHEIRTRFEVMIRDARISFLERQQNGSENEEKLQTTYEADVAKLHDDFAFIANCNIGSEFMDDDKKERVKEIASRTWL